MLFKEYDYKQLNKKPESKSQRRYPKSIEETYEEQLSSERSNKFNERMEALCDLMIMRAF